MWQKLIFELIAGGINYVFQYYTKRRITRNSAKILAEIPVTKGELEQKLKDDTF